LDYTTVTVPLCSGHFDGECSNFSSLGVSFWLPCRSLPEENQWNTSLVENWLSEVESYIPENQTSYLGSFPFSLHPYNRQPSSSLDEVPACTDASWTAYLCSIYKKVVNIIILTLTTFEQLGW